MASYPKWLYHPSKEPVVVEDEAAHRALGSGWCESPADIKAVVKPEEKAEPKAEEKHAHHEEKSVKKVK